MGKGTKLKPPRDLNKIKRRVEEIMRKTLTPTEKFLVMRATHVIGTLIEDDALNPRDVVDGDENLEQLEAISAYARRIGVLATALERTKLELLAMAQDVAGDDEEVQAKLLELIMSMDSAGRVAAARAEKMENAPFFRALTASFAKGLIRMRMAVDREEVEAARKAGDTDGLILNDYIREVEDDDA